MLFEKRYAQKIKTGTSILSGEIPETQFAGKTFTWKEFELGNHTPPSIEQVDSREVYAFNSLGYRCPEFAERADGLHVASFGCSETFGIGVRPEDRFSGVFCGLLREASGEEVTDWNLGAPAKSNDFIGRCLPNAIQVIRPDVVLVCFTYIARREFYGQEGDKAYSYLSGIPSHEVPHHIRPHWEGLAALNNLPNNLSNLCRNFHNVKAALKLTGIPWVYAFVTDEFKAPVLHDPNCVGFFKHVDYASDGKHAGPQSHRRLGKTLFEKYNAARR